MSSFSAQVNEEIDRSIRRQMIAFGEYVSETARRLAPYRTGTLSNSIRWFYDDADYSVSFHVDAPYGMYVEFGTRYMVPRPYLRPALNAAQSFGLDPHGVESHMAFNVTPVAHPIRAVGGRFQLPPTLTDTQREHVRTHLVPMSRAHTREAHYRVSRTRLHVRTVY